MTLLHHVLAVSMAESNDEDITQTNVMGFICVSVDSPSFLVFVLACWHVWICWMFCYR